MNNSIDGRQDRAEERGSTNLMRLFGQMVMLPFTVFVQGIELFVKTIQGMQRATDEGMNVMVGGTTQAPGTAPGDQSDLTSSKTGSVTGGVTKDGAATIHKEEREMPDRNLSDDMLKLVRYKVLFVKRDYETAFPEREELVPDNMTDTAYTAWKIAEFIQSLNMKETKIPAKWGRQYPRNEEHKPPHRDNVTLFGFPEGDKKWLRVYYEVLDRYVREDLQFEQEQLDALKDIAKAVREKPLHKEAGK